MNKKVKEFVDLIESNKSIDTKEQMEKLFRDRFDDAVKDGRALYHTDCFAVRFSYSKNRSFSNTVLSLSKLEKYDHIPCFAVHVRRGYDNLTYLMNTTFLKKISQSSKELRTDNIKGSFNGSDIIKEISCGVGSDEVVISNSPENFDRLFAMHLAADWRENLERLVENTNSIVPRNSRFDCTEVRLANILDSPTRAKRFVNSEYYESLRRELNRRCDDVASEIAIASHIENVNIRGRLIESLISANEEERERLISQMKHIESQLPVYDTRNDIGDFRREYAHADTFTDIKTKIIWLDSNPKAYNIDKFLECMSHDDSVFMFFFVGIDEKGVFNTALCSVYHKPLIENTVIQHHWSGRATRGVAQFIGGGINDILSKEKFVNEIDVDIAEGYLHGLINK